ncbi:MAG: glycosyltransferase family 39 protein [Archangium sp.]|nr:glycosyltransferase family 39 protein [Archangium sp.]MDP3570077.1 glycosyltransferase family 39 protein [Archangium sp.]
MSTQVATNEPATLTEAILGKELITAPIFSKVRAWPSELRAALVSVLMASAVLLPYLGAVGLWDPWEVHYGEVAREMIQRNDYVHPFWENAWFFSKPAFTMWMQALGLQAADAGSMLALVLAVLLGGLGFAAYTGKLKGASATKEFWGVLGLTFGLFFLVLFLWSKAVTLPWLTSTVSAGPGALPIYTEWGFRLPFTSFSILAIGLLTYALSIAVNPRAALATAVVLVTMPLYFLLSRQAVTDTPIISATICGVACAMVGLFDKTTRFRSEWWYGAYVFFAIATLAKGLLGFGVPMVVFIAYVALREMTWKSIGAHFKWMGNHLLMPMLAGVGAAVVVGGLAYLLGKRWNTTFMAVPVIDNVSLISAPSWLFIMWGSLAFWVVTTIMLGLAKKATAERPPPIFSMAYDMRLGTGILLFLAVCLPWYYEMFTFWRLDDESKIFWFRFIIHDHFARLGSGVHTTTPGGDFTYFILQGGYAMFPWVAIIPGALATAGRLKIRGLTTADGVGVVAVLWFVVTWALIGSSATKFHHYTAPMLPPLAILMGLFIDKLWEEGIDAHGLVLLFGVPIFMLVGKDLASTPKHFTDLFVYNYDRPYPAFLTETPVLGSNNIKQLMGLGMGLAGAVIGLFALLRSRAMMFTAGLASVMVFALWFNWSHWVQLSHHWTQRDQFWRYYTQRRPGEPIASFLMNWRGETFYSRNTVKQIKDNPQVGMKNYSDQPGREWSLVEHARLGMLKSAVGDKTVTLVDKDLNNKFVLVIIE